MLLHKKKRISNSFNDKESYIFQTCALAELEKSVWPSFLAIFMNFWLLSDLINLSFSDLPSVSLKMSSTLDGDLIRKGDTVYLQCEVKANPSVHTIHWTFEVGGMEQPVLKPIKRKGLCRIRIMSKSKSFWGYLYFVGQTFTEMQNSKMGRGKELFIFVLFLGKMWS